MRSLLLISFMLLPYINCLAQKDNKEDGYELPESTNIIKVYYVTANGSISSHYKIWNNVYFFYIDKDGTFTVPAQPAVAATPAVAAIPAAGGNPAVAAVPAKMGKAAIPEKTFYKIHIPSGKFDNPVTYLNGTEKGWDGDEATVVSSDFDKWLLIEKEDMDTKVSHFKTYGCSGIISALILPLKIHPQNGSHQNSLVNSNFNIGPFLGVRIGFKNKGGMSIGGFANYSSINQTASNNSSISDKSNTAMDALSYGFGLIFDIAKKTQIGVVAGADHGFETISRDYLFQDNIWFAFSLSFKFLDFGSTTGTANK